MDTALQPQMVGCGKMPVEQLKFRFSLDKFVNALAHFAARGVGDLTKLKAMKLLYLADRYHLHKYGRPIVGDRYIAMDFGPVPEDCYQLVSRLMEPVEVEDQARKRALEILHVYRGKLRRLRYPILTAKRRPDLSVFSKSDLEALDAIIREYGRKTARELVDLTHTHNAYRMADAGRAAGSSAALPYEYFFADADEKDRDAARERAESYTAALAFADALRTAGATTIAKDSLEMASC